MDKARLTRSSATFSQQSWRMRSTCPTSELSILERFPVKKFIKILTTSILFTMSTQAVFAEEPVFAAEEHCLAYYTTKTMFFFADVEVIG